MGSHLCDSCNDLGVHAEVTLHFAIRLQHKALKETTLEGVLLNLQQLLLRQKAGPELSNRITLEESVLNGVFCLLT